MEGFLMVFGRLTGLFLSAPIFANKQLPVRIKILVIMALAAVIASFTQVNYAVELTNPVYIAAALILEIFIGYTIGFVAYVVFAAIQLAGQLMDMQMGFGVVNVLDPQSGMQIPMMGNFSYLLALLLYLVMNGHHYLLQAIIQSYQVIPVMGVNLGSDFMDLVIKLTTFMFVIAVKISAPVVVAILISDVSMGFIARTVPQMNVFMVGLPLKIMIGFFAVVLLMPVYVWFIGSMFAKLMEYLDAIILAMGI